MEPVSQLRKRLQQTRNDQFFQSDWLDRKINRTVSIYFTGLLLKTGISANGVTLLSILSAVTAGILFCFPSPIYWLVGWVFMFLFEILDCCDGEVARYRRTSSQVGHYNDEIGGLWFIYPFLRMCLCTGIYFATGNFLIFILGFIFVLGWIVFRVSPLLSEILVYRGGLKENQLEPDEVVRHARTFSGNIMRFGMVIFGHIGFFFTIPVITLMDMFIDPFSILGWMFDIRFLYFALITAVSFGVAVLRVYDVNKYGVKLNK